VLPELMQTGPKKKKKNVSAYNTTIYFIYIKWYIDRATCFDLH
jgi:type II restriction/modification system DNA methylase subunit YeeA